LKRPRGSYTDVCQSSDTFLAKENSAINLENLISLFEQNGVPKSYVKALAKKDNSENQSYLGGGFSSLNIFPGKKWLILGSRSQKKLKIFVKFLELSRFHYSTI